MRSPRRGRPEPAPFGDGGSRSSIGGGKDGKSPTRGGPRNDNRDHRRHSYHHPNSNKVGSGGYQKERESTHMPNGRPSGGAREKGAWA